jgi:hypothetical protein
MSIDQAVTIARTGREWIWTDGITTSYGYPTPWAFRAWVSDGAGDNPLYHSVWSRHPWIIRVRAPIWANHIVE